MLKQLYTTRPGGYALKLITRPGFSRKCARVLDSGYSRVYIKRFIRKNDIDMTEYVCKRWRSFNDFFIRQIRPDARPVDMTPSALISPCDCLMSAYTVTPGCRFRVKGAEYTLATLLNDEQLAREYGGGLCIIFRLMPDNYHRYIYPDWGSKGGNTFIQGKLHTVRPVAQGKYSVYATNSREYTTLHTRNFGDVVFMEVGALMVGRICNHHGAHTFARGEEKGYFEYGGSTIIMLLKKGVARLDREYQHCINNGRETEVKLGMRIGTRAHA